jgi:hypothetical protein
MVRHYLAGVRLLGHFLANLSCMRLPTASRLAFREMTDADRGGMAALLGDEDVMRLYPGPVTRGEASDWIARNQHRYRDTMPRHDRLADACGRWRRPLLPGSGSPATTSSSSLAGRPTPLTS